MKQQSRVEARRRLMGTWRSDAPKTMKNWTFPRKLAAARVRQFRDIFGKMTWKFSSRSVTTIYDGVTKRGRYSILWADDFSAVVLFSGAEGENCHHLFFEEKWFFLVAGRAGNVEYFKKIDV